MAGQGRHAGERLADDFHGKVSASVARPFVADMPMAFIDHFQGRGRQGLQRSADPLDPLDVGAQGNVSRNGFTSTLA